MSAVKKTFHKIRNYEWGKLFFELIVVFLGVTAGFILNNWRMEQDEKRIEEKYLASFLQDINLDIPELQNAVNTDSLWLHRVRPLLKSLSSKSISVDSAKVLVKKVVWISRIDAHSSTYEEITNSGNLNLLTDFELKSRLVNYYLDLGGVKFIDDYFNIYFTDFVMPFILSEYSVLTEEFNSEKVIHTIEFANVVAGYFSLIQQRLDAYQKLLSDCILLRDELNKKL